MTGKAKHIVVHGDVQGVGFRFFVQRTGTRLGLTGDVRNLPDGTVDIVVEGSPNGIEKFISAVRRGPSMARVGRVEVRDVPGRNYQSFLIEGW